MFTSIVSPEGRALHVEIPAKYKPESVPFGDLMVELKGDCFPFFDVLRWLDDMPYIRIPPEAGRREEKVSPHWDEWHNLPYEEITPGEPE